MLPAWLSVEVTLDATMRRRARISRALPPCGEATGHLAKKCARVSPSGLNLQATYRPFHRPTHKPGSGHPIQTPRRIFLEPLKSSSRFYGHSDSLAALRKRSAPNRLTCCECLFQPIQRMSLNRDILLMFIGALMEQIDGPGKWNKTNLNQGYLVPTKLNYKGHLITGCCARLAKQPGF